MSSGSLPFAEAYRAADLFRATVARWAHTVTIAGSMRRLVSQYGSPVAVPESATVGDIEMVVIPDDGFNEWLTLLYPLWQGTDKNGRAYTRDGARYKKLAVPSPAGTGNYPLDLFYAAPDTYGYILTLRTGPAEFNLKLVRARSQGGWKPENISLAGGAVYRGTERVAVPVPDEQSFFDALGLPILAPHLRSGACYD